MPTVELSTRPLAEADVDAVIVTAFEDGLSPAAQVADAALDNLLAEMREVREFRGRFAERPVIHTLGRLPAPRLLVLGLGKREQLDSFRLHNAFHFAGTALRKQGVRSVAAYTDPAVVDALSNGSAASPADVARAVVTGLLLGNFEGDLNKSEREPATAIESIQLAGLDGGDAALAGALREAEVLAEATNRVCTWAAAPSNTLTPTLLAEQASALYEGTGLEVEVLRRADLEREGMGALLGVARGSDEPPVMIVVRHDGGRPDGPRLALVGKGITFDTGGISLKPAAGMEMMKWDMAGGAAVLAAMWAIARLNPPANVVAVVPATENMPGGHAYKPGDVLVSKSGKTIEVTNTDAEGRIILADGLAKARELGATHIVDVATLTGACVVALGHVASGLMTNDRALGRMVKDAAVRAGDRLTELPLHPEYDVALRSDVADMKNAAGREAGAITAAVFLREFVGDTPWVHLDIAGAVWNGQSDMTPIPKGPSGTPVRTFVHLARAFAEL
ncbi:MAG: leucyl aminopeptidase [Chloroflexi bacterium]|jgi:leucyl aminopeptidase|nr:leucyl aminopeptidase [Chloroflexota bacterium]